jgi:signal transduction histidine kinase
MSQPPNQSSVDLEREQTDNSLRLERDEADAAVLEKTAAVDADANAVLLLARKRADEIVVAARDEADRLVGAASESAEGASERKRTRADDLLEKERAQADSALAIERAERKEYLTNFLAAERDSTDEDLTGERAHADTLIAARDEFLATVSHDLRSLLSGLALNAQLLVARVPDGADGEKYRRYALTSQRMVGRMNRLVNDLLDMASIEAGKLSFLPDEIDVAQILRDTLEAFEPLAIAKRITLDLPAGAQPLRARVDGDRILQVLANLVSNAIKFTPTGGCVSVHVSIEKNELQFAVTDSGIGIPAEEMAGVFERFHQVNHGEHRGLGLGLHISKFIVEAHGGRMWVDSKVGTGSTFHFALPASLLVTA